MIHPKEKKERSLGTQLQLKGERCASPKCAAVRRPFRPGVHKRLRRAVSEYGLQLREKQKAKFSYGVTEQQLRNIFVKGGDPLQELERRLDNVVFRLGFALSRSVARQYISHGHITVNGKRISSPSYMVKIGQTISIRSASQDRKIFAGLPKTLEKYHEPDWLLLDAGKLEGKIRSYPKDSEAPFNTNLIVEYYSK